MTTQGTTQGTSQGTTQGTSRARRLEAARRGSPLQIALTFLVSALAVGALAIATGAWLFGPARLPERVLCGAAGIILLYLEPFWTAVGVGVLAVGIVVHLVGGRLAGSSANAPIGEANRPE